MDLRFFLEATQSNIIEALQDTLRYHARKEWHQILFPSTSHQRRSQLCSNLIMLATNLSKEKEVIKKNLVPLESTGSMYVLIFYQSYVWGLYRTVIILSYIGQNFKDNKEYTAKQAGLEDVNGNFPCDIGLFWINEILRKLTNHQSPAKKIVWGRLPNPPLGGSEPLQHSIPTKIAICNN